MPGANFLCGTHGPPCGGIQHDALQWLTLVTDFIIEVCSKQKICANFAEIAEHSTIIKVLSFIFIFYSSHTLALKCYSITCRLIFIFSSFLPIFCNACIKQFYEHHFLRKVIVVIF